MASLKEIKQRIRSVQNTKKITYAMKLVSAAKLRKNQDVLIHTREYKNAMAKLINNIMQERAGANNIHPLMQAKDEVKKVRLVVIGGRRGLCGAFNSNLNRLLEATFEDLSKDKEVEILVIGKKPAEYCQHKGYKYIQDYENLPDNMNAWPLEEIYSRNEEDFLSGKVDEVLLLFSRFNSAMSVTPSVETLLPLSVNSDDKSNINAGDILYKPSIEEVFSTVVPKYAFIHLVLASLESKTSEQGSRMTAMDAATNNAGELIDTLVITHNKLRQANITNDILDIIGGAAKDNN